MKWGASVVFLKMGNNMACSIKSKNNSTQVVGCTISLCICKGRDHRHDLCRSKFNMFTNICTFLSPVLTTNHFQFQFLPYNLSCGGYDLPYLGLSPIMFATS